MIRNESLEFPGQLQKLVVVVVVVKLKDYGSI